MDKIETNKLLEKSAKWDKLVAATSKACSKLLYGQEIIDKVRKFLGKDGIKFFRKVKEKHGKYDAVWMNGKIPHCVHFREGMQIRNFLRTIDECKKWDPIKLDDTWVEIIEGVMGQEERKK